MREREHASSSRNKGKIIENPGQYPPVITINNKGKYPISRIANITLSDFGGYKSKRFNYNCKLI